MAREKAKDPSELTVEEKLKNLYSLQTMLSKIDRIKTLRGELPLEVQDLEDEIAGLTTRIEKINNEVVELKREISERNNNIEVNKVNIARFKSQIEQVRNNREYDNLNKQIEYAELDNQLNEKKIAEAKGREASRRIQEPGADHRASSAECVQAYPQEQPQWFGYRLRTA